MKTTIKNEKYQVKTIVNMQKKMFQSFFSFYFLIQNKKKDKL